MKIETNENGKIILKEVYLDINLESDSKDVFGICMRDSGFEFKYCGQYYEAKEGEIKKLIHKHTQSDELPTTNGG